MLSATGSMFSAVVKGFSAYKEGYGAFLWSVAGEMQLKCSEFEGWITQLDEPNANIEEWQLKPRLLEDRTGRSVEMQLGLDAKVGELAAAKESSAGDGS